jgi:carbon starvation protein
VVIAMAGFSIRAIVQALDNPHVTAREAAAVPAE